MRDVFQEVAAMPWFSREPSAREAFARYLLGAFPSGSYQPETDRAGIVRFAKKHFSRQADLDRP
jgi:hypothetical protein